MLPKLQTTRQSVENQSQVGVSEGQFLFKRCRFRAQQRVRESERSGRTSGDVPHRSLNKYFHFSPTFISTDGLTDAYGAALHLAPALLHMCCCVISPPPPPSWSKKIYITLYARSVGVRRGINSACIGHFTPRVDLSDGPFKK